MDWFKADVNLADDPKMFGLSDRAKWTYVAALCYCARHETDGHFPSSIAPRRVLETLESAALIRRTETGWLVPTFTTRNPPRAEMESLREQRRASGRAGGQASAQARAEANGRHGASSKKQAEVEVEVEGFTKFWVTYPRRVARRAAASAFAKARQRASLEDILRGAQRYRDDPQRKPEFTAHPTTWLNQDRWTDESAEAPPARRPLSDSEAAEQMRRELEARRG